jgi:hypothetical protein
MAKCVTSAKKSRLAAMVRGMSSKILSCGGFAVNVDAAKLTYEKMGLGIRHAAP